MKNLYEYAVQELKNFSQSLDRTALLVNKPWALIDEDQKIQKLIFKNNKELIISKNGSVTMGSWEYLPEAKALLINRGVDSILCNEGFLDEGVLVLKRDGTHNQFFVLANENIVKDLNALEYLRKLKYSKLQISYGYLHDGRILEIWKRTPMHISVGDEVTIDDNPAEEGCYTTVTGKRKYFVNNNKIAKIFHIVKYLTASGLELYVEQESQYDMQKNDPVFIDGKPAADGKYRIKIKNNIIVEQGRIKKILWF